jgi:hypothetical protein
MVQDSAHTTKRMKLIVLDLTASETFQVHFPSVTVPGTYVTGSFYVEDFVGQFSVELAMIDDNDFGPLIDYMELFRRKFDRLYFADEIDGSESGAYEMQTDNWFSPVMFAHFAGHVQCQMAHDPSYALGRLQGESLAECSNACVSDTECNYVSYTNLGKECTMLTSCKAAPAGTGQALFNLLGRQEDANVAVGGVAAKLKVLNDFVSWSIHDSIVDTSVKVNVRFRALVFSDSSISVAVYVNNVEVKKLELNPIHRWALTEPVYTNLVFLPGAANTVSLKLMADCVAGDYLLIDFLELYHDGSNINSNFFCVRRGPR